MKKSILILLAIGLIFAAGTTHAAVVDLQGLSKVNPSQGTFFFDIVISDVGSLANWDAWNLSLTMTGGTNAVFDSYTNVSSNADYVFFGDSFDYQWSLANFTATGGDATASGSGVVPAVGDLIARLTIDVSAAQIGEWYTISFSPADQNFVFDTNFNFEDLTQFGADYSFQIVPIPGAVLLLGSGLLGLLGIRRRMR